MTRRVIHESFPGLELNTASAYDLAKIKGVGPKRARDIMYARERAPFSSWREVIRRVRGVGAGTVEALRASGVIVEPPRPIAPAPQKEKPRPPFIIPPNVDAQATELAEDLALWGDAPVSVGRLRIPAGEPRALTCERVELVLSSGDVKNYSSDLLQLAVMQALIDIANM